MLVEAALTRLDEAGIRDTPLHEEWSSLQNLDAEEEAFCEASARLGVDPFNTDQTLAAALIDAAEALPQAILVDFLDAVNPQQIGETLSWIREASEEIEVLTMPPRSDLSGLQAAVKSAQVESPATDPWHAGLVKAQAARAFLQLDALARVEVEDFVSQSRRVMASASQLDAYGATEDGTRLLLSRASDGRNARFASARALWHALTDAPGEPFLLTRARTVKQKAERAFAAEFLAPSSGIEELLGPIGWSYDVDDVERLAERYSVSTMIIQHQIDNNVQLGV
jgi:hypothetical protein